jgi:hypothetical protein
MKEEYQAKSQKKQESLQTKNLGIENNEKHNIIDYIYSFCLPPGSR